jgi:AmmeMemoRadiSam system protein B
MMGRESANARVREAAVAGLFYPGDPSALRSIALELLEHGADIGPPAALPAPPKALIVPHAGFAYSGSVAGAAYRSIAARCGGISRVVLIGPSHRVYFRGIAASQAQAFSTPLGEVRVDDELRNRALAAGTVVASDLPHASEHCLEVQLPFLQTLLGEFTILPLVAGVASAEDVAGALADVWGGAETLVLVSSDLSHYRSYASARAFDADTAAAIVERHPSLSPEQACGAVAINGLLALARERTLAVREIARLNSGDTAGDRTRVVGYGAFAIHEP